MTTMTTDEARPPGERASGAPSVRRSPAWPVVPASPAPPIAHPFSHSDGPRPLPRLRAPRVPRRLASGSTGARKECQAVGAGSSNTDRSCERSRASTPSPPPR